MLPFNVMRADYLLNAPSKMNSRTGCLYSALTFSMILAVTSSTYADEFFNPAFLSDNPEAVADLSRFDNDEGQAPGKYRVEVYLNEAYQFTSDISFKSSVSNNANNNSPQAHGVNDESGLDACITRTYLDRLGVNTKKVPTSTDCIILPEVISQASSRFDFERQRLYISIPQAELKNTIRGYIEPEEWDEGVPALLLNYTFNGSNTKNDFVDGVSSSYFVGLNSGLNVGAWRLRNNSTWNYNRSNGRTHNQWQNINSYLQRSVPPLKSSLIMGDSYSPGEIFDSIGFRGVQLASDDNMLPDSMRGFAPVVRGIAASNAKVTIKQNGYVIYQTYVSPGAFEIADLYPTSSSGDLQVVVTETSGAENTFSIPYSAVPVLQREGRVKYSLTVGEYRSNNTFQDDPVFTQGTLIWGLQGGVTVYGGSQLANNYRSIALGSGLNLGQWGAISADVTHANSVLADNSRHQGQSLRFLYAKSLSEYGTHFQLLGYRYSTEGFYSLEETTYRQMSGYTIITQDGPVHIEPTYQDYYNLSKPKKGRLQLSVNQQLGQNSSIFLTGSRQTYWRSNQSDNLWQIGASSSWNDVSYSLTYSNNRSSKSRETDNRLALNISLPIGRWLATGGKGIDITRSNNSAYATYSANTDMHGRVDHQVGGSGTLLPDNNLNYSLQQGYGNRGVGGSGSINLGYQGGSGNSNLGYNYTRNSRQVNFGLSGGIVGHPDGITLSQPLGDTNVLIKAPGAGSVNIENATGVSTDWRGYAVVPYATTYRLNRIALDSTTLKDNTEIDDSVMTVVPTFGALVSAEFKTYIGVRALITLLQSNGKPVPFGASVSREDEMSGSIVGENGQVYLSGLQLNGTLKVKWGSATNQACTVTYNLPKDSATKPISYLKAVCQ